MSSLKHWTLASACLVAVLSGAMVWAQDKAPAETERVHPGKALLASKCFQCHNDAMFRDQRQDRRAWESTLYRMVGRGALWTEDEIKSMADYLATDYGPQSPPTPSSAR